MAELLFGIPKRTPLQQHAEQRARRRKIIRQFERTRQDYARHAEQAKRERDSAGAEVKRLVDAPAAAAAPQARDLRKLLLRVSACDKRYSRYTDMATQLGDAVTSLRGRSDDTDMMRSLAMLDLATRELEAGMPSPVHVARAGAQSERRRFLAKERRRALNDAFKGALQGGSDEEALASEDSEEERDIASAARLVGLGGGGGGSLERILDAAQLARGTPSAALLSGGGGAAARGREALNRADALWRSLPSVPSGAVGGAAPASAASALNTHGRGRDGGAAGAGGT